MAAKAESHYDRHADDESKRTPLRLFHNDAKRALLNIFAKGSTRLLDLACGRGGDVHKWLALRIPYIRAIDISPKSLDEARARYAKVRSKFQASICEFERVDLARQHYTDANPYDTVTCFFALHYFWKDEDTAKTLMRTASENLKAGGHFIGIGPCGRRILECVKHGPTYDNGVMAIEARWSGKPECFSSAYTLRIRDTVVEDSVVDEYLVFANVLKALGHMFGLVPIAITHPYFDALGPLHVLQPPYGGPEKETSQVFAAFVLQKT